MAGFLLMWPLGYLYGLMSWPTFHLWGLIHGGFFGAWPTLSSLAFLVLGYLPIFARYKNTAILIFALIWGMMLATFLGIGSYLTATVVYGLLTSTAIVVAAFSFLARQNLTFALLAIAPILFSALAMLPDLLSSPSLADLSIDVYLAWRTIKPPLIATLAGWGIGYLARTF